MYLVKHDDTVIFVSFIKNWTLLVVEVFPLLENGPLFCVVKTSVCRWPDSATGQVISSHGIGLVILEYSAPKSSEAWNLSLKEQFVSIILCIPVSLPNIYYKYQSFTT